MTPRDFHRSQSLALGSPSEKAYRRAERELRDFHRARSLDVILEEDHADRPSASAGGGLLTKKGAVLCLADLANEQQQEVDRSENTTECGDQRENNGKVKEIGAWGHFTIDSPSENSLSHHMRTVAYPTVKPGTSRRFRMS